MTDNVFEDPGVGNFFHDAGAGSQPGASAAPAGGDAPFADTGFGQFYDGASASTADVRQRAESAANAPDGGWTFDNIHANTELGNVAQTYFKKQFGWDLNRQDAIDRMLNSFGDAQVNTIDMADNLYAAVENRNDPEQLARLAYMKQVYDALPNMFAPGGRGWSGLARNAGAAITDPINLVSLGLGGLAARGAMAKVAAPLVGDALMQAAERRLASTAVENVGAQALKDAGKALAIREGVGGAVYGGVNNALEQGFEKTTGLRDSYSAGELLGSAAEAAAIQAGLGVAGSAVGSKLFGKGLVEDAAKARIAQIDQKAAELASERAAAAPDLAARYDQLAATGGIKEGDVVAPAQLSELTKTAGDTPLNRAYLERLQDIGRLSADDANGQRSLFATAKPSEELVELRQDPDAFRQKFGDMRLPPGADVSALIAERIKADPTSASYWTAVGRMAEDLGLVEQKEVRLKGPNGKPLAETEKRLFVTTPERKNPLEAQFGEGLGEVPDNRPIPSARAPEPEQLGFDLQPPAARPGPEAPASVAAPEPAVAPAEIGVPNNRYHRENSAARVWANSVTDAAATASDLDAAMRSAPFVRDGAIDQATKIGRGLHAAGITTADDLSDAMSRGVFPFDTPNGPRAKGDVIGFQAPGESAPVQDITGAVSQFLERAGLSGRVTFDQVDRIATGIRDFEAAGRTTRSADGSYRVEVANGSMATARHEVFEVLHDMGVLNDKEMGTLEAMADRWRQDYDVDGRWAKAGLDEDGLRKEAIAEAFAHFQAGDRPQGVIATVFEKVRQFIDRVGNMLRGRGYQTWDDVFRAIEEGKVGRRETRAGEGAMEPRFQASGPEEQVKSRRLLDRMAELTRDPADYSEAKYPTRTDPYGSPTANGLNVATVRDVAQLAGRGDADVSAHTTAAAALESELRRDTSTRLADGEAQAFINRGFDDYMAGVDAPTAIADGRVAGAKMQAVIAGHLSAASYEVNAAAKALAENATESKLVDFLAKRAKQDEILGEFSNARSGSGSALGWTSRIRTDATRSALGASKAEEASAGRAGTSAAGDSAPGAKSGPKSWDDAYKDATSRVRGMSPADRADIVSEADKIGRVDPHDYAAGVSRKAMGEKEDDWLAGAIGEVLRNFMISGLHTHAATAGSGAVMVIAKITESALSAAAGAGRQALGFGGKGVGLAEAKARMDYFSKTLPQAYSDLKSALKDEGFSISTATGAEAHSYYIGNGTGPKWEDPFWNKVGQRVQRLNSTKAAEAFGKLERGIGGRITGAIDKFFRTLGFGMEAAAYAAREGERMGLSGNALSSHIDRRVAEIAANPTSEAARKMSEEAAAYVFQNRPGEIAKTMNALKNINFFTKLGGAYLLPFVTTPANIISYALNRVPVIGLMFHQNRDAMGKLFTEAGRAELQKSPEIIDELMGRQALGALLTGIGAYGYMQGWITGSADYDKTKAALERNADFTKYSVKIGGAYFNYDRLEPLGMLLGIPADMARVGDAAYHAWTDDDKEMADRIAPMLMAAAGSNLLDKSMFNGVAGLFKAIEEPEANTQNFFARIAGNFVPNMVGQGARITDQYVRDQRSIADALIARIPFARQSLPPKVDVFGRTLENEHPLGAVGALLSPVQMHTDRQDPAARELLRLGVGVKTPPRAIRLDGESYDLDPQQYNLYATLSGKMFYNDLTTALRSGSWAAIPDVKKEQLIRNMHSKAVRRAQANILMRTNFRVEAKEAKLAKLLAPPAEIDEPWAR